MFSLKYFPCVCVGSFRFSGFFWMSKSMQAGGLVILNYPVKACVNVCEHCSVMNWRPNQGDLYLLPLPRIGSKGNIAWSPASIRSLVLNHSVKNRSNLHNELGGFVLSSPLLVLCWCVQFSILSSKGLNCSLHLIYYKMEIPFFSSVNLIIYVWVTALSWSGLQWIQSLSKECKAWGRNLPGIRDVGFTVEWWKLNSACNMCYMLATTHPMSLPRLGHQLTAKHHKQSLPHSHIVAQRFTFTPGFGRWEKTIKSQGNLPGHNECRWNLAPRDSKLSSGVKHLP